MKQVPIEKEHLGEVLEPFRGSRFRRGSPVGGWIPPKLEIAQHRKKSGDPGSIPGFGDFLSDSRLFAREKEGDAGEEQGGVRWGRAPLAYGGGSGGVQNCTGSSASK